MQKTQQMKQGQPKPTRLSTTCPFSRIAAGYMALLGRSRCVGNSNIISRAWRYLSGREGEPVTK